MDNDILTAKLRSSVKSRVIAPEDGEYEQARTVFYGWVDRRPEHLRSLHSTSRHLKAGENELSGLCVRQHGLVTAVYSTPTSREP